jgi:haloacetate dehalogenase
VLLGYGHPRTSTPWRHRVALSWWIAVCPDSCGYGRSRGRAPSVDHCAHSKGAAASELVSLMRARPRFTRQT